MSTESAALPAAFCQRAICDRRPAAVPKVGGRLQRRRPDALVDAIARQSQPSGEAIPSGRSAWRDMPAAVGATTPHLLSQIRGEPGQSHNSRDDAGDREPDIAIGHIGADVPAASRRDEKPRATPGSAEALATLGGHGGEPKRHRGHSIAVVEGPMRCDAPLLAKSDALAKFREWVVASGVRAVVREQRTGQSAYRAKAKCAESAARRVTFTMIYVFNATKRSDPVGTFMIIRHGEHTGHEDAPAVVGSIWTVEQLAAASDYVRRSAWQRTNARTLLSHLRAAGLDQPTLPSDRQVQQWLTRQTAKVHGPKPAAPQPCIGAAADAIAKYDRTPSSPLGLFLLPGTALTTTRGFVPFTCRKIVEQMARFDKEAPLILATDAKMGIASGGWSVITAGILTKYGLRPTTLSRSRSAAQVSQGLGFTSVFRPIFCAAVDAETTENYSQLFSLFLRLWDDHTGRVPSVREVHKDWNKASEAARRDVLPKARPCNDWAHAARKIAPSMAPAFGADTGAVALQALDRMRNLPTLEACRP